MIELVLEFSLAEWEVSDHDSEQYDAHREDISLPSIVELAFADFRSHVALGSPERAQLINVLVGSEAKVGQFQVHVLVHEYIF